jgi:spermidine synthase
MPPTATPAAPPARLHPFLLVLFVGSGCSALIYEIVWFQMLQLVVGSTALSMGVLLGTFMGGMCLGSLLLPRFVKADRHPLKVYAALELGIAVCGLLVLAGMPLVDDIYAVIGGQGTWGWIARVIVAVISLLVPTVLMGATLPAVARWVESSPAGVAWLGFFYGGNIFGAVAGCLVAGFYLLRVSDMTWTTLAAAGLNVVVAGLAFGLSILVPFRPAAQTTKAATSFPDGPSPWPVYLAIALSGAGALGAEVVWTRLLSLMLGGTVYTFAIILAVFLIGLGIGSTIGASVGRRSANPRVALGFVQVLLAGAIWWAAYQLTRGLPYWPIDQSYAKQFGPWLFFQIDFVRCLWCVFPAALLWGASFPLALAGVAGPGQDAGKLVGRVYAANTVGAILGAVLFSTVLVREFGSQNAQIMLVAIAAAAAVVACLFPIRTLIFDAPELTAHRPAMANARLALMPLAVVAGVCVALYIPPTPWQLIAYGRDFHWQVAYENDKRSEVLFVGEGMNSSVAVVRDDIGDRNFYVSGKIEASSTAADMKLQRMLGHIPALVHPNPKSVLIVGCGAGVTAGSFLTHPSIERVVICEIEPLIPTKVAPNFKNENYGVTDAKHVADTYKKTVQIVYDDARHFMLTASEKFDIITSDPIHPWVKGAATLYTKEYFELVKKRLNPGGMVTQWVPLYQSSPAVVKSEVATFFAAFPEGSVWGNPAVKYLAAEPMLQGYDTVLLGHVDPLKVDMVDLGTRIETETYRPVVKSLADVEFFTLEMLFARYTCRASDLKEWLVDAEINRDRNLRLQYLAGLSVNSKQEGTIYDQMMFYRTFPEDMFLAPIERQKLLRQWLGFPQKDQ